MLLADYVAAETADSVATEPSAYCPKRGVFFDQVRRWRAQDANAKLVLSMVRHQQLERLFANDQRKI